MDSYVNNIKRIYLDADSVDYTVRPWSRDDVQEVNLTFIQSEGTCEANIIVEPLPYSRSKIVIHIFAENTARVNCVCSLAVAKDIEGVETDLQIRSWPFDRSKISARPEMKIANSNIVATHGNALGVLKPDQQYYLATRGFSSYKELVKQSLLANE